MLPAQYAKEQRAEVRFMHYWEMSDKARDLRARALALMDANEIAPTPINYELWFFHELGQNRDLNGALDAALTTGLAKDVEYAKGLHSKFFVRASGHEIDEASLRLEAELKQLTSVLDATDESSSAYGRTLAAAAQQLVRS